MCVCVCVCGCVWVCVCGRHYDRVCFLVFALPLPVFFVYFLRFCSILILLSHFVRQCYSFIFLSLLWFELKTSMNAPNIFVCFFVCFVVVLYLFLYRNRSVSLISSDKAHTLWCTLDNRARPHARTRTHARTHTHTHTHTNQYPTG